jgi:phytoene dehydrogenase-like protein
MIDRLIEFSLKNKFIIVMLWIEIAGWGLWAMLRAPIDAIPDLSDNQVIVFTDWQGRSPQEVEDQITYAGGAQSLTDALVRHLEDLGGQVETGREVTELPLSDIVLADITPRQLLRIAGSHLSTDYRKQLERFRYGPGAFKIDYALNAAIPWTARECLRAATLHIGGSLEEIAQAERTLSTNKPFVLLGQPSLFDSSRASSSRHTAWAYCHVPNGSAEDYTESIERQIVRFAPEFRDCILSRSVSRHSQGLRP